MLRIGRKESKWRVRDEQLRRSRTGISTYADVGRYDVKRLNQAI